MGVVFLYELLLEPIAPFLFPRLEKKMEFYFFFLTFALEREFFLKKKNLLPVPIGISRFPDWYLSNKKNKKIKEFITVICVGMYVHFSDNLPQHIFQSSNACYLISTF